MAAGYRGVPLSPRAFVQRAGVAGLGLLAGCRLVESARQPARIPRMGYLEPGPTGPSADALHAVFLQALRELGYVEGQTIHVVRKVATVERLPSAAAELARLPVE